MKLYRCDTPGCGRVDEQGSITGGMPRGWSYSYQLIKNVSHPQHYCVGCTKKRADERKKGKTS